MGAHRFYKSPERHRVESRRGATAVGGRELLLPAAFAIMPVPQSPPWPRFLSPLIEPDVRFSRIRLSDEIIRAPTESWPFAVSGE